ncbi:response regulator transcription factor [Streptacidiphilus sp. ASG 303]|uniref:response regulator transcription factor n=1 Tax=Streptacidiphilus sp. ASG 303 TaxID=2896847 RepID=UPI0027E041BE|nr:response regulator transcription factor [Streptacidiphilus sp. ASG 303]
MLVVDDDPTVAEVVAGYLARAGYTVDRAADGPAALAAAAAQRPSLVVLDLMLPGLDGMEVCRRLRAADADGGRPPLPVVMLTARGDEADRILGLELGADDYVTKPFSPRELVLRVGSVLRRTAAPRAAADALPQLLAAGGVAVDPAARRAFRDGRELALTVREFDLLSFLLRHPGRVFSREELMRRVWGWEFGDLSTVTVHVRRLREKVEDDPAGPRLIATVWGVGYRFDPGPGGAHGAAAGGPDAARPPQDRQDPYEQQGPYARQDPQGPQGPQDTAGTRARRGGRPPDGSRTRHDGPHRTPGGTP